MSPIVRKKILIKGVVQGVGFRPHVYKLALESRLCGWVKNDAAGVTVEAQGPEKDLARFIKELEERKPPSARIDSLKAFAMPASAGIKFSIIKSGGKAKAEARIPADLALCADCRRELLAPSDRRYLYPFTNCTNCGPRFTIVKRVPYDRPLTTMRKFRMCPACLAEYRDPLDRRFHAQPNACQVCGPKLSARLPGGRELNGPAALKHAAEAIMKGKIAALQSLGGFHLAADALNTETVLRLRRLKARPRKPLAVMVPGAACARRFCRLDARELAMLGSPKAPVVMLKKKTRGVLEHVAPGLDTIGVMFPYTPLHEALFFLLGKKGFKNPLVMTSGNRRDEPIAKDPGEAEKNLSGLADLTICHDRAIHNRIDDSVGFFCGDDFRLIRRARGYVPDSVRLAGWTGASVPALGCGADLKTTFCLARGGEAFVSQYIGDQSEYRNQSFYAETLAKMKTLLRINPRLIAHDLHPDYASSNFARTLGGVKVAVQHHAAHVLSVAAERGIREPFIGVAFDGTGYGTDGAIWGSEFFIIRNNTWRRAAHLKYFALPGGDAAAREMWRPALALLSAALGPAWRKDAGRLFRGVDRKKLEAVEKMAARGVNAPPTSSMGRLFDAISFIAGLGTEATYEGQGPMELESLCARITGARYRFDIKKENGVYIIDPAGAVLGALRERGPGRARAVSGKFHAGAAAMIIKTASALRAETGIKTVALSGGVFQNRTLLALSLGGLSAGGFKVFANTKVPSNDGGISLGQVYYALNGFRQANPSA